MWPFNDISKNCNFYRVPLTLPICSIQKAGKMWTFSLQIIFLTFTQLQYNCNIERKLKNKKVGQNNLKVTLLLSQNCGNIIKIDKNCKMMKKTQFLKLQKLISPLIVNEFLNFLLENEVERYINNTELLKLEKKKNQWRK